MSRARGGQARRNQARRGQAPEGRSWPVVLGSLAVFGLLGSLSLILALLHVHLVPVAATSSHGVTLLTAPRHPRTVSLPATARPAAPGQAPATLPDVSSAKETALVAAEDARLRAVMHGAQHVYQPEVIPYQGARPTLLLTDGARAWTAADLAHYGALVMLPGGKALLKDNVFVAADAELNLGGPSLRTLYLDGTSSGFTSIVTWGGGLSLAGTAAAPLVIEGWDSTTGSATADHGTGRPYIRAVGGVLNLDHVRASALGFWSGRTGGVAWTGVTGQSSAGGATGSAFTGDTYGAFVARGRDVTFSGDLFEANELDGLHIHRYSVGSRVISSAAARNGGNGFQIDRDTRDTVLRGDLSQHNAVNGFYIDGRPLVSGASASGGSAMPSTGTVLENSAATGNTRTGILIEGGTGTIVRSDEVCAAVTGIALRTGAANAVLTGNDVRCHPRSGLSVGPSAPGTVISGNTLSGARIGIVVRDSGRVTVDNNLVLGATVFGVTARGTTSQVHGVGNVVSGTGVRAVDARAGARSPSLARTDTSGWTHHADINFFTYLEFHPLAALWLGILVLVLLAAAWSYRRRLPDHPYPASTRWRGPVPAAAGPSLALDSGPARPRLTAARPAAAPPPTTRPQPVPLRPSPGLTRPQPLASRPQPATSRPRATPTRPQPVVSPRAAEVTRPQPAVPAQAAVPWWPALDEPEWDQPDGYRDPAGPGVTRPSPRAPRMPD